MECPQQLMKNRHKIHNICPGIKVDVCVVM
uniref:Uncharacterized protein n=1 Tax=Siphoviridae sp. ctMAv2 TaxID=2826258 RepID=A0A8S5LSH3_9CAUD|nr:MAG TPA: hypothetical protein [Siphoviridae sp. ctMAv2]